MLRLNVWLGLRKANDFSVFLPLATLLQKLDTLEAFQHIASGRDGARPF